MCDSSVSGILYSGILAVAIHVTILRTDMSTFFSCCFLSFFGLFLPLRFEFYIIECDATCVLSSYHFTGSKQQAKAQLKVIVVISFPNHFTYTNVIFLETRLVPLSYFFSSAVAHFVSYDVPMFPP